MPNYCSYGMHVRGSKKACEELQRIMIDYELPKHFWRVFEADIIHTEGTEDDYIMHIDGYCAWSVYSCMFEGNGTYATGYAKDDPKYASYATSLIKESERLNLEIEVYSEEPGIGFMEHYHIKDGVELCNECVDWNENYFDEDEYDSIEAWAEEMGFENITEDDLDDGGCYPTGGFDWTFLF